LQLENLVDDDDDVDIDTAWERTTQDKNASATVSLGYNERKQHKPWFINRAQNLIVGSRLNCNGCTI
jgi:hypothetical protein